MHEPAAATAVRTFITLARPSGAVNALCSAIAGFALLAGARAFTFTALLAWREPVLGGAGLVLLALVGWLRWRCGASHVFGRMDAKLLATIDRAECEPQRCLVLVGRRSHRRYPNAGVKRSQNDRFAL
ncbi:MAG TPA: hypothetical protein VEN30_08190 [Paraburkholderia sp.]|nr:hypothetical protein [Paraburkholderia sp.]